MPGLSLRPRAELICSCDALLTFDANRLRVRECTEARPLETSLLSSCRRRAPCASYAWPEREPPSGRLVEADPVVAFRRSAATAAWRKSPAVPALTAPLCWYECPVYHCARPVGLTWLVPAWPSPHLRQVWPCPQWVYFCQPASAVRHRLVLLRWAPYVCLSPGRRRAGFQWGPQVLGV